MLAEYPSQGNLKGINKLKMKATIEELREEFDFPLKALKLKEAPFWMLYSEFLEQKLIQSETEQNVSEFVDLFDNNNPIEITSDKKMEVCMNCAETFDINYSGCICTTCFLGGENGTLDAEVFMNGCNIIPDASNEDGHDAWTKESVLMLMQLFYKAQSQHSLLIVSEPEQNAMKSKHTAVDWLIEQLTPSISLQQKHIDDLKERAKEMEKEQIMYAYVEGCSDSILDESTDKLRSEDYYNENYGK